MYCLFDNISLFQVSPARSVGRPDAGRTGGEGYVHRARDHGQVPQQCQGQERAV